VFCGSFFTLPGFWGGWSIGQNSFYGNRQQEYCTEWYKMKGRDKTISVFCLNLHRASVKYLQAEKNFGNNKAKGQPQ
jgi:hypothetical protein